MPVPIFSNVVPLVETTDGLFHIKLKASVGDVTELLITRHTAWGLHMSLTELLEKADDNLVVPMKSA